MNRRIFRIVVSMLGAGAVTLVANHGLSVNASTAGFAYLLYVLVIASTWGFPEAAAGSIVSTLTLNFFFLPPVGTFTVADPQNWVAMFTFFATSLIASRLSTEARRRAAEAVDRQRDLERLYTFGRAILLIDTNEGFAKRLCACLTDTFEMSAVALFDQRTQQIYRAGPMEFEGMDSQLQEAAMRGVVFSDPERHRVITPIRLGAQPIASLAVQGERMPDSVLQSIANLVAIGLERARAQELAQSAEVTRRSERLRTTLLDAMAHELKTPLTPIRAATSALLAATDDKLSNKREILLIADEEAARLEQIIDNALEMAQVDSEHIDVRSQPADLAETVREIIVSMGSRNADHRLRLSPDEKLPSVQFDQRLIKLAVKQLLDNALKYSPSVAPIEIRVVGSDEGVAIEITDHGKGIPPLEQPRVFERFYRGSSVEELVPGSGLGLSIAHRIVQAHGGDLTVHSRPGETTFRLVLPYERKVKK